MSMLNLPVQSWVPTPGRSYVRCGHGARILTLQEPTSLGFCTFP